MRPWLAVLLLSVLIGAGIGWMAPERWGFGPADGLWIGSALYVAGLRRYVERAESEGKEGSFAPGASTVERVRALLPGLLLRAAIFTALLSVQAFLCFHVVPGADVRRGFVLLSAWVVLQAMMDTGAGTTRRTV